MPFSGGPDHFIPKSIVAPPTHGKKPGRRPFQHIYDKDIII